MSNQNDHGDLYREIVTNMLEGVMVISMNGRITMLNQAAERMLGLTQQDIGNSFANVFLTREGTDSFTEVILDTIYEKEKVSNMPVDYALEGENRNLSLTTSYIHNDGEKSVVVVIDDVTELNELRDARTALDKIRKLNQEYEKAKDEAVRANEAKSLFLSNMSHEIRTPINAVLGMNEMILRECTDEQLLSYAANIQSSGKTLLFLINDILDMSKIESGKMEIVKVDYVFGDLLMDLWNVIFLRAQEKGLTLSFSLDETMPKTLYGDDVRIKQIVTNLLTNAVKYTPQGGIEVCAAYERTEEEQINLILSVKDTGMGIKEEDMGKLFESFQRLDEEKNRNIEGTGLGMNITMSLLKLMDGDMKVESEYGKGSTFTVTIPQRIVCADPTGSFETIKGRQEQNYRGKQQIFEAPEACVLVVDDNDMNRKVFQSLLKRTKMKITTADSGRQCLELVKKEPFHIIFMDHMMPEMDGIETLHEIRKLSDFPNEDTPVIVLTANALSGAREVYLQEGFVDFLTKPIDGDLLEQTIAKYLPPELIQRKEAAAPKEKTGDAGAAKQDLQAYGISTEKGLSLAKGDEELYLDLAGMFVKDKEKQEIMWQYISAQNMADYAILVHGLKGNARTLGADALAALAYEHEMRSKAGDCGYVAAHWDELLKVWDKTLEGFQIYCESCVGEGGKYEAVSSEGKELLRLSQDDLERVAALLDDFETQEAIGQLKEWIGQALEQEMYERIKEALTALEDEFDEEKAIQLLRE
ncbi:MAG: response regulator [Bacteroidales bacterium]|nr:response regulator [Lachnoclostridium sp.]MCM1384217.1 response regulator [Lachnoclostridium sp.]MCM1466493.1 response regulator [Bacteroidales bacterium]